MELLHLNKNFTLTNNYTIFLFRVSQSHMFYWFKREREQRTPPLPGLLGATAVFATNDCLPLNQCESLLVIVIQKQ